MTCEFVAVLTAYHPEILLQPDASIALLVRHLILPPIQSTQHHLSFHISQMYDYILTFEREQVYIWNAKWTLSKCLFFLNRYLVVADVTLELNSKLMLLFDNG